MTGEMSIDYQYRKVLEERKEVQEGKSTHSCCIATRLVRQEEGEGRSIDFVHSIALTADGQYQLYARDI